MKPAVLTIEYPVGDRMIRRRLDNSWTCPLCQASLLPEGDQPLGISRRLHCPECDGSFNIVHIEMPETKPKRRPFGPKRQR